MLVFAVLVVAALIGAAALRARDAPYIAYERGDPAESLAGLTSRAEAGDGFAAYLVAQIFHFGAAGTTDLRAAAGWYLAAARAGEIRAVAPYLDIVLRRAPDEDACRKLLTLLEFAGRAGDPAALVLLGENFRTGRCVAVDAKRAAAHFAAAQRADRRMESHMASVRQQLSEEEARTVRPLPDRFDLAPRQALARFIEEAPALLTDSLR